MPLPLSESRTQRAGESRHGQRGCRGRGEREGTSVPPPRLCRSHFLSTSSLGFHLPISISAYSPITSYSFPWACNQPLSLCQAAPSSTTSGRLTLGSGPSWNIISGEVSLVGPACVPQAGPKPSRSALSRATWANQRTRESQICREGQLRFAYDKRRGRDILETGHLGYFKSEK